MNKRILQGLLTVFLLAALLVPVTAVGDDGTVTECSHCHSTNISVTRTNRRNGEHRCIYKCGDCNQETYGAYVPCDVTMPTKCTETATCPTCGHKYTGTTHNMPDEVSWTWNNANGKGFASVAGKAVCMDCHQEFTREAYSIGYKTTKNPTCQSNKEVTYTISGVVLGGRSYSPATTVEVPNTKTDHFPIRDNGKAATCTKPGLTSGSHCLYCNTVLEEQKEIPASGHLDVRVSKKEQAATCTQDGWTSQKICNNCKQIVQESEIIKAKGHTPVVDPAVAATCTKAGKTEGSHCSVCKEVLVEQQEVPAKGHTFVTDAAKAATCTENGLTEGSHCSVCNWVQKEQTSIPATGHAVAKDAETVWDWNIPEDGGFAKVTVSARCQNCGNTISEVANNVAIWRTINATCTTGRKWVYSVTVPLGGQKFYGEKEVDDPAVPATGHKPVTDAAVAATCTETGLTEGSHCSVCNTILTKQEVIPATGHKPVTDAAVAATCTETGLTEGSHCSVCNTILTKQEVIPAAGHKPVTDAAVAATCTETGLTEGSHCSVCNTVLTKQEIIPARGGHEFGSWYVVIEATETTAGEEERRCLYCNATEKRIIPALGTEEDPRLHVRDAENEELSFETSQSGHTLTVTLDYEEAATLLGSTATLKKLLEQGVQILEFVTPQGTARVAVAPLLEAMGSDGRFELTVTRQGAQLLVNDMQRRDLLL